DHVDPRLDRGGERLPDGGTVGDDLLVDRVEPAADEPVHQQRAGAVLVGAVGGAGGGDDDAGGARQGGRRRGILADGAVRVAALGGHLLHRCSSSRAGSLGAVALPRVQSPLFPPDLASTWTSSMLARWSTAL